MTRNICYRRNQTQKLKEIYGYYTRSTIKSNLMSAKPGEDGVSKN